MTDKELEDLILDFSFGLMLDKDEARIAVMKAVIGDNKHLRHYGFKDLEDLKERISGIRKLVLGEVPMEQPKNKGYAVEIIALILFILVMFCAIYSNAQTLSWVRPKVCEKKHETTGECLNEIPDPSITSYRVYFRLITQDPETCSSERCETEFPYSKAEDFTHNIELSDRVEKYNLQTDQTFIRGAIYDIRIAALANNLESLKNDNSVRTTIKGTPEEPGDLSAEDVEQLENETDEEYIDRIKSRRRELDNNEESKSHESEEINFGNRWSAGSISSNVGGVSNGNLEQRRQGNRRFNDYSKPVSSVLGHQPGKRDDPAYKHDRFRDPTGGTYFYKHNDRNENVSSNVLKPSVAQRSKRLFRNDNSHDGRDGIARIGKIKSSVQSDDTVSTYGPSERSAGIEFPAILKLILGIAAFTLGVIGILTILKRYNTKGKHHEKLSDHYLDSIRYIGRNGRNS